MVAALVSPNKALFSRQFSVMYHRATTPLVLFGGLLLCAFFAASFSSAKAQGLIRDGEIESLLKDYSRPLFKAAGLVPERVGIGVINHRSLNAFVTNGQNIYIHTGLILEADEPNMVIGVIAHEIGHITGGHLARGSQARANAQVPALIGTILGLGSIIAGAGDVGMALITGSQQISLRNYLTYNRGQEAAADNTALDLLDLTEQSTSGIIDMMEELANQEILTETHQDPYVRSHPMSRDRVQAYREGAKKSAFKDARDSDELIFRHTMAQAKIYGFLDQPSVTLRRYRNDSSPQGRYARAIAHYRQGLRTQAIQLVDGLIAEMPDNPWLFELKGQIYYETGQAEKGIAPYQKSIELRPDEPLLLIGLASCQLGIGQNGDAHDRAINQQALVNLRKALRLDPSNTTAYFQMSKGYGQLGQTALAQWALAEYYAALGSPEAKRHAKRARQGLPKGSVEYIRAADILNASKAH